MPSATNTFASAIENKALQTFVKGAIIQTINNGGFPTENVNRDKNIQLFWQQGYEAKKLANMLLSFLVGIGQITLDSDVNQVQSAIDNNWITIFDLQLI